MLILLPTPKIQKKTYAVPQFYFLKQKDLSSYLCTEFLKIKFVGSSSMAPFHLMTDWIIFLCSVLQPVTSGTQVVKGYAET